MLLGDQSDTESEVVIPISFNYPSVTLQLLTELIGDNGQVTLAWVADDGSFTMHEAIDGIVPPKEKLKDNTE